MNISKGFLGFCLIVMTVVAIVLGLLLLYTNSANTTLQTHNTMLSTNYATSCLNYNTLEIRYRVLFEKYETAMKVLQFKGGEGKL